MRECVWTLVGVRTARLDEGMSTLLATDSVLQHEVRGFRVSPSSSQRISGEDFDHPNQKGAVTTERIMMSETGYTANDFGNTSCQTRLDVCGYRKACHTGYVGAVAPNLDSTRACRKSTKPDMCIMNEIRPVPHPLFRIATWQRAAGLSALTNGRLRAERHPKRGRSETPNPRRNCGVLPGH